MEPISPEVLAAWAGLKAAECEQQMALADSVGMGSIAAPFARDAAYFREIERYLSQRTQEDETA